MCGIAGIYRRKTPDPLDPARVAAMCDKLIHRGPDDYGYLHYDTRDGDFAFVEEGLAPRPRDVCLGHRRLSIIDLSRDGRQPMLNRNGDIAIVYNGEIFNYLELRGELADRGYSFRSHTDTEVILHAYEEWGEHCVVRFNGMWAFAIWDQRTRAMFCSRDRFGIKPFYYRLDASAFVFASEIKGILPALDDRPRANHAVIGDYLIDGSLCRNSDTFFETINRLPPAHNLVVRADGSRITRYWDYPAAGEFDDRQPVETFGELLRDSVRLRLRSDVPVSVALSGGIDSSSILALAAGFPESHRLKAFTAVFPGEPYDESGYAQIASEASGAELHCLDYQAPDLVGDLKQVIWSMDYPALDGQVISRWRLMSLASRHVKVVLEGQGADEMLGGYVARYFSAHLFDQLAGMRTKRGDSTLRQNATAFLEVNRRYGRRAYAGLFRQMAPASMLLWARRSLEAGGDVYAREFIRANPGRLDPAPTKIFHDRLTSLMHADHATTVLPMLLKFGDALSMASSVESRVPFLDHRLVEFVFRLPARYKLDGAVSKGILRAAVAGLVPEAIRSRNDKVGFKTPLARWITDCMDTGVRPVLLSKRCRERGIFDPEKVAKILARHVRGESHLENSIFRWLSVELWFRLFIDGEGMPAADASFAENSSAVFK